MLYRSPRRVTPTVRIAFSFSHTCTKKHSRLTQTDPEQLNEGAAPAGGGGRSRNGRRISIRTGLKRKSGQWHQKVILIPVTLNNSEKFFPPLSACRSARHCATPQRSLTRQHKKPVVKLSCCPAHNVPQSSTKTNLPMRLPDMQSKELCNSEKNRANERKRQRRTSDSLKL